MEIFKRIIISIIFFIIILMPSFTFAEADISKDAYKFLYENTSDYNSRILDTIYWALGGMFSVIILFIGTNTFFNYKNNKKEMENLKKEYDDKFLLSASKMKNEYAEKFAQLSESIKKESLERIETLNNQQIEQIKGFNEVIIIQVDAIKTDFQQKIDKIDAYNIAQSKQTKELKQTLTKEFTDEVSVLKFKLLELEAVLWDIRKVPVNAVRYYVKSALIRQELGYSLNHTLNKIIEILEKGLQISLNPDDIRDITRLFDRAGDEYIAVREKVLNLLKGKNNN